MNGEGWWVKTAAETSDNSKTLCLLLNLTVPHYRGMSLDTEWREEYAVPLLKENTKTVL
jgi:hypothetical protein